MNMSRKPLPCAPVSSAKNDFSVRMNRYTYVSLLCQSSKPKNIYRIEIEKGEIHCISQIEKLFGIYM